MRVDEIMTTSVKTIGEYEPFKRAAELMLEADVSGIPVVDDTGRLVGIVTEADLISKEAYPRTSGNRLLRALATALLDPVAGWRRKAEGTTVGQVMTTGVKTVEPQDHVRFAARSMLEHGVKRLPVVDEKGMLVGIVSRHDLLWIYHRSDSALQEAVRKILDRTFFLPPENDVTVLAKNGIVTLHGTVFRESDVEVAPAIVRGVEGVVDVVTDLEYREKDPMVQRRHAGV
ncbi:MAG: CBS domain-containing protein [Actinomycetota bacterium]